MAYGGRADAGETVSGFPRDRIAFQPIVDLTAWRVTGFEALARFADGAPPPEHLDRAEREGVREELELALIACGIREMELLPRAFSVTFNASGTTILRPELADLTRPITRGWGLEITEGATTADLEQVRARVSAIGGRLLVDDAGAACADETRIARLRPDVVKIDRALFWRIAEDADARRELGGLVGAARDAGARVLVEGVSSAEQVETARAFGADYGQGFHLGMPTFAEGVPAMLAELHRGIGVDAAGL
ncbi:EAL domain-containing protein [Leucobacter zeae]|nr:EAL domain-containing protein [Leucobacter zeae]